MADHRKTPTRLSDTFEAIALIGSAVTIAFTAWFMLAAPGFLAGISAELDHRHPGQGAAR